MFVVHAAQITRPTPRQACEREAQLLSSADKPGLHNSSSYPNFTTLAARYPVQGLCLNSALTRTQGDVRLVRRSSEIIAEETLDQLQLHTAELEGHPAPPPFERSVDAALSPAVDSDRPAGLAEEATLLLERVPDADLEHAGDDELDEHPKTKGHRCVQLHRPVSH